MALFESVALVYTGLLKAPKTNNGSTRDIKNIPFNDNASVQMI